MPSIFDAPTRRPGGNSIFDAPTQRVQPEPPREPERLHPIRSFGRAVIQSAPQKVGMAVKGLTAYTPGSAMGADTIIGKAGDFIGSLRSEKGRKAFEKDITGKLWPWLFEVDVCKNSWGFDMH